VDFPDLRKHLAHGTAEEIGRLAAHERLGRCVEVRDPGLRVQRDHPVANALQDVCALLGKGARLDLEKVELVDVKGVAPPLDYAPVIPSLGPRRDPEPPVLAVAPPQPEGRPVGIAGRDGALPLAEGVRDIIGV